VPKYAIHAEHKIINCDRGYVISDRVSIEALRDYELYKSTFTIVAGFRPTAKV